MLLTCFHYIHQNPWKAGLVSKMENWKYSSFSDFAGFRDGTLCNKQLALELLILIWLHFMKIRIKLSGMMRYYLF